MKKENIEFYFALCCKTHESLFNNAVDEHNIYIISTNIDPAELPNGFPYFEYSQIINEYDFVGEEKEFYGHKTINYYDYYNGDSRSSWDRSCVVAKRLDNNFVMVDVPKTLEKLNKKYKPLKLTLVETIPANDFQKRKCSLTRLKWIEENANWYDVIEDDISNYLDEINENLYK